MYDFDKYEFTMFLGNLFYKLLVPKCCFPFQRLTLLFNFPTNDMIILSNP